MSRCKYTTSDTSSSSPTTRIDAPDGVGTYLVPYLPVTPTFLVLFVIFADVAGMNRCWRWEEMSFSRSALLYMSKFFCGSLSLCPRNCGSLFLRQKNIFWFCLVLRHRHIHVRKHVGYVSHFQSKVNKGELHHEGHPRLTRH
jgi:hypothetical protein